MKTSLVIQIVQLGQYGTKSTNTYFCLIFATFDPANIGVPDSLYILHPYQRCNRHARPQYFMLINNSNTTSFFRFANKQASYPFGIISLAHAPVNVTDFSIGSINCNPNNADRGCSFIRVT